MPQDQLFDEFPQQTKKDWLLKAKNELQDKPITSLQSDWYGLNVEPYYAREDLLDGRKQTPLNTTNSGWVNYVKINVEDEKKANNLAKETLMLGATGILFRLDNTCNYNLLLESIELSACAIAFDGEINIEEYLSYVNTRNSNKELCGFINNPYLTNLKLEPNFFPSVIEGNDKNELSELRKILINIYQLLTPVASENAEPVIQNIAYKLSMCSNYFFGIAKIRALRILLNRFYRGYKLDFPPAIFHIIAQSTPWANDDYKPHENMFKATSSAMAAIIGGCNSLIIDPGSEDEQEALVTRNISSILEFESYLGKVADPAAGSFFLENLTNDIVDKVWQDFTNQVKE